MQGDIACAEGALAVGCRFFADYPITPASEITAFNFAEKYRLPVFLMADALVGHMTEKVIIPPIEELEIINRKYTNKPLKDYLAYNYDEILILGLGNVILSDDGMSIFIARKIKEQLPDINLIEASAAGFRVIDEIIGYDKLILIDSIKTKAGKPGDYYKLGIDEFKATLHHSSAHDMDMFSALELMKKHGAELPNKIIIYAIEVEDTFTYSEQCTENVAAAIPILTSIIREQFPDSKI